jgi:hypothetical protein
MRLELPCSRGASTAYGALGGYAITLTEALARFDGILPVAAPQLVDDLRPPASVSDIDALRSAPHPLSEELIQLLSWHDGQAGAEWWPVMSSGPLLSARDAIEHFTWLGHRSARTLVDRDVPRNVRGT